MKLLIVRHAETAYTLERRYSGSIDLPLCAHGIAHAQESAAALRTEQPELYAEIRRVYVSPLLRCQQTARIFFPAAELITVPDLRETSFGVFEGHTAAELLADEELAPVYQAWIDSVCELPVPGGDTKALFSRRVQEAFRTLRTAESVAADRPGAIAVVAHGGTNMAILDAFTAGRKQFWAWDMQPAAWRVEELV